MVFSIVLSAQDGRTGEDGPRSALVAVGSVGRHKDSPVASLRAAAFIFNSFFFTVCMCCVLCFCFGRAHTVRMCVYAHTSDLWERERTMGRRDEAGC